MNPYFEQKILNADPIELYRPGLDDLDEELRASFMGDNMYDCYARMGDPL